MGQQPSKRHSNTSSHSLLTAHTSTPNSRSTPLTPFEDLSEDITPPAKPQELTRLSEIIDPRELLQDQIYNVTPSRTKSSSSPHIDMPPRPKAGMVHSPSGNALDAEEFIAHPNRPLAMWERQERVIQATKEKMERLEAESRMGNRSRMGTRSGNGSNGEGVDGSGKKATGSCCGLWPF